jgi:putative ABC transport system permease protein
MTTPREFASRLGALFGRASLDQRLDEELEMHLEMLAEEKIRCGMSPADARYAACREFGGVAQLKEQYRDRRGIPLVETTVQDVRYAARGLRKAPAFAIAASAVLALGIGASTTIFGLRNAVFFRALSFPEPERLVAVGETLLRNGQPGRLGAVSYPNFADWRSQNRVFQDMAAWRRDERNINTGPEAARVSCDRVSQEYFVLLGVGPLFGRTLTDSDYTPGAAQTIVLSHRWWASEFASRRDVIGKTIRIEGLPATIVGVMPPEFRPPALIGVPKFWMALVPAPAELSRKERTLTVFGRLRPGVPLTRARGDLRAIAQRLDRQHPETNKDWGVQAQTVPAWVSRDASGNLVLVLSIAAGIVLAIACANVASLCLARGAERRKEISLRMALGAGKQRLLRQFLLESLLIALAGGAAGLLLAWRATTAFSVAAAPLLAGVGVDHIEMDGRVVGFVLFIALGSALGFGMLSTISTSERGLSHVLNEGSRTVSSGPSKRRMARLLVVAELSLSLMLLMNAAFIVQTVSAFLRMDWGFPLDHRLSLSMSLSESGRRTEAQRLLYFEEALRRVESMPEVRSAALVSSLPIESAAPVSPVKLVQSGQSNLASAVCRTVSPHYLRTLAVPLLRGRSFTEQDFAKGARVAIVNANMALRFWTAGDPVGAELEVDGQPRTVVGVAGDVINQGLFSRPGYEVLIPYKQAPPAGMTMVVHTAGEPGQMLAKVGAAVRSVDPDQPVSDMTSIEAMHREIAEHFRVILSPLLIFGLSALVLATVGIYSLISHSVVNRSREIGIRMALGSAPGQVVLEVLGEGARLIAYGLCLGGLGGFLLTRFLISRVWWLTGGGVYPYAAVIVLVVLTSLAACFFPAARAARTDPVLTLRNE